LPIGNSGYMSALGTDRSLEFEESGHSRMAGYRQRRMAVLAENQSPRSP
jgi:hypothetical protein